MLLIRVAAIAMVTVLSGCAHYRASMLGDLPSTGNFNRDSLDCKFRGIDEAYKYPYYNPMNPWSGVYAAVVRGNTYYSCMMRKGWSPDGERLDKDVASHDKPEYTPPVKTGNAATDDWMQRTLGK